MFRFLLACIALLLASTDAFAVRAPIAAQAPLAARASSATMGAAKDGPFTPAVLFAKVVLGEQTLLKLRGKAIGIHSQEINKFCEEFGVPKKMNQGLIKKAKAVGSDLGFLS